MTSTIVATKGADDVAGSAPNRLSINGNIEPISDPHSTIPTRARDTERKQRDQPVGQIVAFEHL